MKKTFTFARVAMTLLLFVAGLTNASAGATWIGESYIQVDGTWYNCSGGGSWATGGSFNGHDFGVVSSLSIGAQIQVHAENHANWGSGVLSMNYNIDNDENGWNSITLSYNTYGGSYGNNMMYQTGGTGDFTTTTIDISSLNLEAGEHRLRIYFGPLDGNWDSNNNNNYVATFTVLPGAQTVSAGSGIATYSFDYPLDFTSTSSITAYTVSDISSTSATLTAMHQTVPAGTGLIIMGTSESITPVASGDAVGTNYLKASVSGATVENDGDAFVLSSGAFRPANAGTIPANKAYLLASDIPASARSLSLVIDDAETTGISQIGNKQWLMGTYYDLSGRRVAQPKKGLYIVNGKKVNIK